MSAWTVIQHQELGGTQASITFSSIPATFTDLCLKFSVRGNRSANVDNIQLNINGQGVNTNLTTRFLYGDGSDKASATQVEVAGGIVGAASTTASTFGNGEIYIPNYAGSTNKSISVDVVMENNATYSLQLIGATLWSQTAAISSIALDPQFNDFVQYSSATLYGILKGSSGGVTVS